MISFCVSILDKHAVANYYNITAQISNVRFQRSFII